MNAETAAVSLPVVETFGPTLQGEGPSSGALALFLRLGACNLSCPWCDTPYSWDGKRFDLRKEITRRPVVELTEWLASSPHALVVLTGGEPLLHQRSDGWRALMAVLRHTLRRVEVETNGTLVAASVTMAVPGLTFNVSPKLAHTGDPEQRRIVPEALEQYAGLARSPWRRARFKFVATGPDDLAEIGELVDRFRIPPHAVWVMPEGTTPERTIEVARTLADAVIDRHWNLTMRQHVLLWPGERNR
ncbi:7-carboxy-7-deazaguanine synthase QueE [Kitasatospora sp. RB6PN24]|uniref:7-carboxy-7-deazaguanine synthase QueE n=1 Tax=Kitasatospora humi TaxID=2893891 RepID=UPI001E3705A6|nr:7-carboxy-7-deazaguanine synthase QueE [Kitasatospora humi]MCC9309113.1 7-carboxy-7-deazaguanine synthase QueE [Kitasatospora humi]